MAAPQVTLLDTLLGQIITMSGDGSVEMEGLNTQVQGAAAGLSADQRSDSGSVIVRRLTLWETDWLGVKNRLIDLNTRVTDMRKSLLNGLEEALMHAQSGG